MKSKQPWTLLMVALAIALGTWIPGTAAAQKEGGPQPCTIEGTWYGYNLGGEVFVITITRTGARTFSAVGQGPSDPSAFPGVYESFSTQGDLTRTGPGTFDSTWLAFSALDPVIYGFELGAITSVGRITMTGCDGWEATFTSEALGFHFGRDPFEDGVLVAELGTFDATYRRIPKLPQ